MKTSNTKRLVGIAMLGAIAFVLMFFAFPILPSASFMKVDFSDVPVLMGMFLYGPIGGVLVALIRTVLHYIQTGGDIGYPIGDIASFIASLAYAMPIYFIVTKQQRYDMKTLVMANIVGTVSLTTVLSIANWFVITPLYITIMGFNLGPVKEIVLYGVVPFNILKGLVVGIVFIGLFAKLKPFILRNQLRNY